MTLILGVDSGLDGAFAWYCGGRIVHHVLTRTLVVDGRIDMRQLSLAGAAANHFLSNKRVAYLEEPFNNAISGGASTAGYTDQCKRWGRLQGWLESWGYEVRGVQAKTWQRELLDLARFEVRTEVKCKPRLAEGWTLKATIAAGAFAWSLRNGGRVFIYNRREGQKRADAIESLSVTRDDCTVSVKTVLSHDTKAASLAYVRANFPDLNLIPPRARNPHDGLADAVCIAVWGSRQIKETP
jgi:hypothetical protein